MFVVVFSCATISTDAGKNSLLPVWSPWVWVLMMWVIGLSVTVFTWSRIAWPQLASLVSTSTTPLAVTNTAVLPPPPRAPCRGCPSPSRSAATFGPAAGCCATSARPATAKTATTTIDDNTSVAFHAMPSGKKTRCTNQ